jgi:hypothetical protein
VPFEAISEAPELFRRLAAAGLGKDAAGTIADVVSCPGESAAAFFARVEVERAKVLLQDLGELSADTAHARRLRGSRGGGRVPAGVCARRVRAVTLQGPERVEATAPES